MQDEKAMVITFWRPSRWDRSLFDVKTGPVDRSRLLEEAYTWEVAEPIWNSIEEANTANRLRELLVDGFSPDKLPKERRIEDFRNVLDQIRDIVRNQKSKWSDCEQTEDVEDAKINLRANLLLSFLHHLTWACDVFVDVPEISITVR